MTRFEAYNSHLKRTNAPTLTRGCQRFACGRRVGAITWNSTPNYDSWGVDTYWTCNEWMDWYFALKTHYGKATAQRVWIEAFGKADPFMAHLKCRYDRYFFDFMKKEGLSAASNPLINIWMGAGSIFNGLGNSLNLSGKLLPIALIVGAGIYANKKGWFK